MDDPLIVWHCHLSTSLSSGAFAQDMSIEGCNTVPAEPPRTAKDLVVGASSDRRSGFSALGGGILLMIGHGPIENMSSAALALAIQLLFWLTIGCGLFARRPVIILGMALALVASLLRAIPLF